MMPDAVLDHLLDADNVFSVKSGVWFLNRNAVSGVANGNSIYRGEIAIDKPVAS
jgi:hypothetical protein